MAAARQRKPTSNCGSDNEFAKRAALALNFLVSGPHRDKRIARIFGCSTRMARYLCDGRHWSLGRLNQASQKLPEFETYLANPLAAKADALTKELDRILSELRGEPR